MGINVGQLKQLIIIPTLNKIGLYSKSAVNLLLGTCAQESQMGTYLKQINGPALGIFQTEPATHDDLWDNFLHNNSNYLNSISDIAHRNIQQLVYNLSYATAVARLLYFRAPEELPDANDKNGLALYWKKYYNTEDGAGLPKDFVNNYERFIES